MWQGQPQPAKQSSRGKKVAIGCGIAVIAFMVLVGGCAALVAAGGGVNPNGPGNPAPPEGGSQQVVYTVNGESAMNVTYGANGQTSQQTNPTLPWTTSGPAEGSFGFYSLTAQNGQSGGEISCRIEVGGKVLAENTSSGPYAVVTCSGTS